MMHIMAPLIMSMFACSSFGQSLTDSQWLEYYQDSLNSNELEEVYEEAYVIYSSDSSLKVFSISGYGYGGVRPFPLYFTSFHWSTDGVPCRKALEYYDGLREIETICSDENNKSYLLIGSHHANPEGFQMFEYYTAKLLRISGDSLSSGVFEYNHPTFFNESGHIVEQSFGFATQWSTLSETMYCYLHFDPEHSMLNYRAIFDENDEDYWGNLELYFSKKLKRINDDDADIDYVRRKIPQNLLIVTGSFKLENNRFVHHDEWVKTAKKPY